MNHQKKSLIFGVAILTLTLLATWWFGQGLAQSKVTLRLAAIAQETDQVKLITAEYTKRNPNVTFNTTFIPIDQYNTVLSAQLTAGTGPDILYVFAGGAGNPMSVGVLAKNGYLADLSGQPWTKDILPNDRPLVQYQGKTYVLPVETLIIGLFYNKKLLQDRNIKVPRTWSELLSACETLKQSGVTPLLLGNQTPWVTQLVSHAITATTVYAKDPSFDIKYAQGKLTLSNSPGYHDALRKYLELNERGCFNKFPNSTPYEEVVRQLATGKGAMAVQVSGTAIYVNSHGMKTDQLGIAPFPATDNTQEKPWIFASIISSYGINAKSRQMAAAQDFIRFLAQPTTLDLYLKGRIPAIPYPAIKVDPVFGEMMQAIREGRSSPVGVLWPNPKLQDVYVKGIQQLFDGATTIDQLLAEMDKVAKER